MRVMIVCVLAGLTFSVFAAGRYYTKPLVEDRIHDPTNEAITVLQQPVAALAEFPLDRRGLVNWVKALDKGIIEPRKSRDGDPYGGGEVMLEMDMNIIMTSTANMPYVKFPHLAHTRWLACSNCHPKIFIPQKDANPINMTEVLSGQFCGRCHGKVAFPLWTCERCHSVPHSNSPAAWWNKDDS